MIIYANEKSWDDSLSKWSKQLPVRNKRTGTRVLVPDVEYILTFEYFFYFIFYMTWYRTW